MYIKRYGPQSWSGKLHDIANQIASKCNQSNDNNNQTNDNPLSDTTSTAKIIIPNNDDKQSLILEKSNINNIKSSSELSVHIYGPYISYQLHENTFDYLVMFAGGIGITPFISIYLDS